MDSYNTIKNYKADDFLLSVWDKSEIYIKALKNWAKQGIYRNPLDNSLLINYPPITAASPVSSAMYSDWRDSLLAMPDDMAVALYIHIPYCSRRCTYCNYYSLIKPEAPESYIDLLIGEINNYQNILAGKKIKVNSIYIGGGTPSLLTEKQLEEIIDIIYKVFKVKDNIEVSMEFHPELIKNKQADNYLKHVRNLGINRVSIGIQSLDDLILTEINRGHTADDALSLLELILAQGFDKVNIDLIYGGLPFESLNSVYNTLKALMRLAPTSISKHFCEIKAGSVDFERYKKVRYYIPIGTRIFAFRP